MKNNLWFASVLIVVAVLLGAWFPSIVVGDDRSPFIHFTVDDKSYTIFFEENKMVLYTDDFSLKVIGDNGTILPIEKRTVNGTLTLSYSMLIICRQAEIKVASGSETVFSLSTLILSPCRSKGKTAYAIQENKTIYGAATMNNMSREKSFTSPTLTTTISTTISQRNLPLTVESHGIENAVNFNYSKPLIISLLSFVVAFFIVVYKYRIL